MNNILSSETFSKSMRKISFYFIGYCFVLLLVQISLVSIVAFFHFLLDHELSVVENWLSRNAWELLCLSKIIALYSITRVIKLNLYDDNSLINHIKKLDFKPMPQVIIFIFYILVMDLGMLLRSTSMVYNIRSLEVGYALTSFLGSAVFFFLDMILVVLLLELFPVKKKRNKIILLSFFTLMFLIVTNVIYPYSKVNILYLIIFYSTLGITLFKFPDNIGNLIWLATSFIGLSSIIFGQDLVWSSNYSLLQNSNNLPIIGHLICWLIGMIYLVKSVKYDDQIS